VKMVFASTYFQEARAYAVSSQVCWTMYLDDHSMPA
jgi:hypothetical protein